MNKTKKLTQGAMLMAIIGAVMLIDRQLSFLFEDVIVLLVPVIIAIYSCMYEVKDGAILCVGLAALTILFGSLRTYMYMPIALIAGVGISYVIKKDMDRRRITAAAMLLYIIGELIVIYLVSPLLGIDIASQIESINEMFNEAGMMQTLNQTIANPTSFIMIIFFASTVLLGVMEGYLTSILTFFVLKRLKIKDVGISSVFDIKLSKPAAYGLLAVSALGFIKVPFFDRFGETFVYSMYVIGAVATLILAYFGYLFCVMYMRLRTGKKGVFLLLLSIFLLLPFSYFALVIFGFLYGSGPLRDKIESMIQSPVK
ncbi:MAG: DUF2232 domain-containing protein [Erysipelotrichaceae bacterium]|nr:DUF2232 domain-containing protein [Erysipelotrichaceae bacterium]